MGIELAPHQLTALKGVKNGSILKGGVGTGKSRTALAYYFFTVCRGQAPLNGVGDFPDGPVVRRPRDLYIFTTKKKRDENDWFDEAKSFGLFSDPRFSVGNVRVVVDTWNNIGKYVGVKDAFVIFDEQRLVGSGAWVKAFYEISANNEWILLSATPGDTWVDYIPVFVAHGHYRNRTEFIRRHVVWSTYSKYKIDRYVETKHLDRLRAEIIVDMPFNRHTTRHLKTVIVDYNEELFNRALKDRWHVYEERPLRDVGELFIVMRKIVNSDISRLGAILKILEKHPKLIVFYNFNYELDTLRTLKDTLDVPVHEYNGQKHELLPEGDAWVYLVQYTAGAEGWNCVTTDATAFYSLTYSYKIFEQAQGRIDRLNTLYFDLYYFILRSTAKIDTAIVKSLTNKKIFSEGRSAFAKGFLEAEQKAKPVKQRNPNKLLAQMCIDPDTHPEHDWSDGMNKWYCFGGPFDQTQKEIMHDRANDPTAP